MYILSTYNNAWERNRQVRANSVLWSQSKNKERMANIESQSEEWELDFQQEENIEWREGEGEGILNKRNIKHKGSEIKPMRSALLEI